MSKRRQDLKTSLLELRRNQILELMAMSKNVPQISREIGTSESTIRRDVTFLKARARNNIRTYVEDRLLFEFDKSLAPLDLINKMSWDIFQKETEGRDKILALTLIRDTNSERIEMYTHSHLLQQALKTSELNNNGNESSTISIPTHEDLKRQAERELSKRMAKLKAKEKQQSTHKEDSKDA